MFKALELVFMVLELVFMALEHRLFQGNEYFCLLVRRNAQPVGIKPIFEPFM
jgi:hypothetical protein